MADSRSFPALADATDANNRRALAGLRWGSCAEPVARIEQSEIRELAVRLTPDFVSLNPGYAC
jgi:hypothetical protein